MFLKEVFEILNFKKVSIRQQKQKNYPAYKDLKIDFDVADLVPPVLGRYQKGYCKFRNFREDFILAKLRTCEVL